MIKKFFPKNRNFVLILSLIFTISFVSLSAENQTEIQNNYQNDISSSNHLQNPFSFTYLPHGPIEITSDSGFSAYGFPGSGTSSDPYRIEGYNISVSNTESPRLAISISDTTSYFVIRNCYIDSNTEGTGGFGIRILYTTAGTVSVLNNVITNNFHGIYLSGCVDSKVSNNFCYANSDAIELTSCPLSTVNNNTCTANNGGGIDFSKCSGTSVFDNRCEKNFGVGIRIYGEMQECSVYDNIIKENMGFGVSVHIDSKKNMIYRNTFIDNNNNGISQAEDRGKRNKWYNSETEEGNYWSDLGDECKYSIDGPSNSKDLYPLNRAETCPNPKAGSTLAIVLPILASVGILSYIVPKFIIPYHREKNIWRSTKAFLYRYGKIIYGLLFCLFIAGGILLFVGLMIYIWAADIDPTLIAGATICTSIVVIAIILGIRRSLNPKKEAEIKHEFLK